MSVRYSAFSPYLALSHSIAAHQNKMMLFVCNNDGCDYQCLAEVDMVQHMKVEHNGRGSSAPLGCFATLVERKSFGSGFTECSVLIKRTGSLEYVSCGNAKSSAATRAKRKQRPVSSCLLYTSPSPRDS